MLLENYKVFVYSVKRDKNWFLSNLYKFYDFWKDVDFYKNNKDKFDTDIQTKRKKQFLKIKYV